MLIVEVSRGERGTMRWKILTGGIPVHRCHGAKAARRFAKNLRKLYAYKNVDPAFAASFFAYGQMQEDLDPWGDRYDLEMQREEREYEDSSSRF